MAETTAATLRVTIDPKAAIEAAEFLLKHKNRLNRDEVLLERLQDLMEHNRMFITIQTPGRRLHFTSEPSYPLIEIMAELAR